MMQLFLILAAFTSDYHYPLRQIRKDRDGVEIVLNLSKKRKETVCVKRWMLWRYSGCGKQVVSLR